VLDVIERKLERGLHQVGSLHVKTTMGKSVRIEV